MILVLTVKYFVEFKVEYEISNKDGSREVIRVEKALLSIGRVPNIKNIGLEEFAKHFTGPTAMAFQTGDPASLSKIFVEYDKTNEKLKIVAGYLAGKILTDKEVKILATLPSRERLLTMIAIVLNSPMQRVATVLNAPIQKLAGVLKALEQQKAKAAPAA